jgi:hypothetical protein
VPHKDIFWIRWRLRRQRIQQDEEEMMSAEMLSAVAGMLLSLAFSYVPGLSTWFGELDGVYKRLVMLAALVLVAGGAAALSCLGIPQVDGVVLPACDQPGLLSLLEAWVAALVANQATYLISAR